MFEEKDFNAKVQVIYNELRMRNKFDKARKSQGTEVLDVAE